MKVAFTKCRISTFVVSALAILATAFPVCMGGGFGADLNLARMNITTVGGGTPAAGGGGADYTVASGCVKCGSSDYGPNNFKICVYNSTGSLLACSNEAQWAASQFVCATFSNGPTLTASASYVIAFIGDGYNSLFTDGVGYSSYETASSYASPSSSITPPAGDGNSINQFAVYLRNAANTKLVGNDTNYTTNEELPSGGNLYYYENLYTCDTL